MVALLSFLIVALTSIVTFASPIAYGNQGLARRNATAVAVSPISLNLWGGLQSLAGFDDFFGLGNFDGALNQQILLQLSANNNVVCRAQNVNLIQQQLAIVQEFAKRVLLEQVCDVETQAILLNQLIAGLNVFGQDLRRLNVGRVAGFDADVAALLLQLLDDQNNLRFGFDFGLNGINIGQRLIVPSGVKWDNVKSPLSLLNVDQVLAAILAQKGLVVV